MLDGVFDERLQHQVGDQRIERVRLHVEHYGQTIPEPGLFDLQILREEIELLLQRDLLDADVLERDAQQIAQLGDHVVGGIDVAVHQRRDRVERVEEEMRLQLPLQRLQLSLDEMGLELAFAQLRDPRLAVVAQRVTEADDGPVGHHLPVEVVEEHALRFVQPGPLLLADDPDDQRLRRDGQRDVQRGCDEDAGNVNRDRALPRLALETAPSATATRSPA